MKNACFVLTKYLPKKREAVLESFTQGGYGFDETRFCQILPNDEEIEKLLIEAQAFQAVSIICPSVLLKGFAEKIVSFFAPTFTKVNEEGAGIYSNGKTELFLLGNGDEYASFASSYAFPYLTEKYGVRADKMVVRAVVADTQAVELLLNKLKEGLLGNVSLEYECLADDYKIILQYDATVSKILIDDVVRTILDGLGSAVYALEDVCLEERLVQLLKLRGQVLSVAESFTGGGIASKITSVSGASEIYFEGLNTYDERSKMLRLGVAESTLRLEGAASDKTAYEMAAGLIATGNCDVSIATTGIAGPKSDRTNFPVGLSYIAIGTRERVFVYKFNFTGDRKEITQKAINHALFLAYRRLKEG